MKIGLICPYNLHKSGGVQECVLALQRLYIKKGHQALIITPKPKSYDGKKFDNVIYVGNATDIKSPFHTTAQISVSVDGKEIDTILEKEQFDVLHFHEPWVPILARQILSRSHSVNVATFHAKLPETMMSKTIEKVITPYTKSILKYIDVYTAVSSAAAEYVSGLTKEPIKIIPNGIDLVNYKDERTKRDNTILYIGRLERRKGLKYLLKSYHLLKSRVPEAKLLLAGDGPDRKKLEQYVKDMHIDDVKFLGYVEEDQKKVLLKQARVFCSPAIYGESFGIVLLEAMASGLPLVAGNNSGYASVMQGRGVLSLVDPRDTTVFANKLQIFYTDKELRSLWLNWSKGFVQQFTYDAVGENYLDLYKNQLKIHSL